MRWLRAVGAALLLLSCSAQQGAAPGDAGTTSADGSHGSTPLPCNVDAVLAASCRQCHTSPPLFGSPMPLLSYEDLHAGTPSDPSQPVYARVGMRVHDSALPMPPPPNARLDANALATLDAWIAAGAPKAAPGDVCTTTPVPDGGLPGSDGGPPIPDCTEVTRVAPATPFTMGSQEEYACYGFDISAAGKRHVIQIRPHIDNAKVVHHVLLLASSSSTSGTPTPCNAGGSLGRGMIYAWAPGGVPLVLPPEAGFPQDQTTHYIVQVHYNNAANSPHPVDSSGFDLCTTPTLRANDADVIAFGSELIYIPARSQGKVTSCYTVPAGMDGRKFFSAFPHMHKLGTSMSTALLPGGTGAPVDMGTENNWNFANQPWLPISATAHTGDVIKAKCAWNNTTDLAVTFGQNTENEMCYSFSAYYPKLGSSFGWAAPATGSAPCQ